LIFLSIYTPPPALQIPIPPKPAPGEKNSAEASGAGIGPVIRFFQELLY
jgi:hypothetical protein